MMPQDFALSSEVNLSNLSLYSIKLPNKYEGLIDAYLISSPATIDICNNPLMFGCQYTNGLEDVVSLTLSHLPCKDGLSPRQHNAIVYNILRGGLNFGLRSALYKAYGWNDHSSAFVSAQRARKDNSGEEWIITENSYKKLTVPKEALIFIGEVIATGTSLHYGLSLVIEWAKKQNTSISELVLFTIGSYQALDVCLSFANKAKQTFPKVFNKVVIVFIEGIFTTASHQHQLTVKLVGTDLLRLNAVLSNEFLESQYTHIFSPLERCVIYDAGARAYEIEEYLQDIKSYWQSVFRQAKRGLSFDNLVRERVPVLDLNRFPKDLDLANLAQDRLEQIERALRKWNM